MLIVAEIGINHNGSLDLARRLINAAYDGGADAVKFQKRTVDAVYSAEALDKPLASPWGDTMRAQKCALELDEEAYWQIDEHCRALGIAWFASAWDLESQEFLQRFDLKYNKIASAMIVCEELLKEVSSEGRHTLISTGMSTVADIDRAVEIFRAAGCPFELMHCVSSYPVAEENANLNAIRTLRKRYGCDVGYSGHEKGLAISFAAAALGITSLERHITLDPSMYGSDQAASLDPSSFRALVAGVRAIQAALGHGKIGRPTNEELRTARKLRAHLQWDVGGLEHAAHEMAGDAAKDAAPDAVVMAASTGPR
jgi:N-acetylneuraminate synthase